MAPQVDSLLTMRRYDLAWYLLGLRFKRPHGLLIVYDFLITCCVTLCYPLHLTIALVNLDDAGEIFLNLLMNVACVMCSVKQFLYRPHFEHMNEINRLIKKLDEQVTSQAERDYHRQSLQAPSDFMLKVFAFFYNSVGVYSLLMMLMKPQPALMFPAWFPFDWQATTTLQIAAVSYQFLGLLTQIIQNIANDAYVPLVFCVLAGHTKLLGMRISRIGHDVTKKEEQHFDDLIKAIEDYSILMSIFHHIQTTVSWSILLQSITNGVNFCVGLIFLVYYATDAYQIFYAVAMLTAIAIEFYPCCYYGSVVEQNFHSLTYEMFSCKWLERNMKFRRTLRIFAEISLRKVTPYAKKMVKINLDTYFGTMRASYSLFCIIIKRK